jgi:type IV secretion system protein VirD4
MSNSNRIGYTKNQYDDNHQVVHTLMQEASEMGVVQPFECMIRVDQLMVEIVDKLFSKLPSLNEGDLVFHDKLFRLAKQNKTPAPIALMVETLHLVCKSMFQSDAKRLQVCVEPALAFANVVVDWYVGRQDNKAYDNENYEKWCELLCLLADFPVDSTYSHRDFANLNDLQKYAGADGLIISQHLRLNQTKSFEHCLIIGPTGSGKSVSFFIPNLLSLPDATIIVSDPKGELFKKTAEANRRQGKRIMRFDPFQEDALQYNPLDYCKNSTDVVQLAQIILANGTNALSANSTSREHVEWLNMCVPLLTSMLLCSKVENQTISHAIDRINEFDFQELMAVAMAKYHGEFGEEIVSYFQSFATVAGSDKTMASIKITLSSNAQIFLDKRIRNTTSANQIEFDKLRERPTVLYVTVPFSQSSLASPILAVFYFQLFTFMQQSSTDVPVYFMLDEFANIGKIPDVDKALATFRSQRVSMSLGIQSIKQLEAKYDNETANIILDNLKTKIVLPGLSTDSAKYFEDFLGPTTQFSFVTQENFYTKEQEINVVKGSVESLMSASEIRRLQDEELLVVIDNLKPFQDRQERFYRNPQLASKVIPTTFERQYQLFSFEEFLKKQQKLMVSHRKKHDFIGISLKKSFPFEQLYTYGGEYATYIFNADQVWQIQPVLTMPKKIALSEEKFTCKVHSVTVKILNGIDKPVHETSDFECDNLTFCQVEEEGQPVFRCEFEVVNLPVIDVEGDYEIVISFELSGVPLHRMENVSNVFAFEVNKQDRFALSNRY